MFDLYVITPDRSAHEILTRARHLLTHAARGRVGVQLRSKQLETAERRALARDLRELTRAHGASLLINDDLGLARDVEAEGVHLPERASGVEAVRRQLGNAVLIGASRHDLHGALSAGRDGASFVAVSPLFSVPDKGEPIGLATLAEIARQSSVPLFALGGIDAARATSAIRAGAHGVAVIRQVWDSADPAGAVLDLLDAIDAGRNALAH